MGQRFQIIENTNGKIKVYHCQWLWGDYAIRRLGTAVRNFINHNENGYRSFQEFLKGSFYGNPKDMNNFDRVFYDSDEWDDNKEICKIYEGKKEVQGKKKFFKSFLPELDNNDGYFYVEFGDKFINGQSRLKGYCFINNEYGNDKPEFKPLSAYEFMHDKRRTEHFSKKQEKEYADGLKTFEKLKVIEYPKVIKWEDE